MIQVQPFTTDVLLTHKMFFILDKIPQNAQEIDIWIQTPTGIESVDFVSVYSLGDGTLIAAWENPFVKLPLHNVFALYGDKSQYINLFPLERIIDIYDMSSEIDPNDENLWSFTFTNSQPIESGDWRCDRGMYGPKAFDEENLSRVFENLNEIIFYEPFLCVNGIGHLVYLSGKNKRDVALEKINNSFHPATGLTIQEVLRLIYEWSILADEPFSSTDRAAVSSKEFLENLGFTDEEKQIIESLPPMQVSQFLSGSETARVRPDNIPALSEDIKNILFKRMGSSSLCALLKIHGIEDTYGLLELEKQELAAGISRFREHYQIPDDFLMLERERIVQHCVENYHSTIGPYVHNQLRLFANKQTILDSVENNSL